MAYSDYGGRAYSHGRREERCDVVLSEDVITSSPGIYPGFVLPEAQTGSKFHVLLGERELLVGLYKQTSATILLRGEEVPLLRCVQERIEGDAYGDGEDDFNSDPWQEEGRPATFEVEGHRIHIFWSDRPCVIFAHVTHPDGTEWSGWSGYEVGAGFDGPQAEKEAERLDGMLFSVFDEVLYGESARARP